MFTEKTIRASTVGVQEEHRALRDLLGQVGTAIASPRCGHRQWSNLMQTLRDQLAGHFRHEEEGGYFREVVTAAPWLGKQASSLEQEHALLRARIDDLVASRFNDRSRVERQDQFQTFCELLLAHEVRENNLVQQSLCDDLGSAD